MTITAKDKAFLLLIKRALFNSDDQLSSIGLENGDVDWRGVFGESVAHAMTLVALNGTVGLEGALIPDDVLNEWQGVSIQFVLKNELLMQVQNELISILRDQGIRGAVIKGASAAFCYNDPESRTLGDVDFLVREEDFDRAVAILESNGFVKEKGERNHCHTELAYKGCSVEIHRYINGLPDGELGEYIKDIFKASFEKEEHFESVGGYTFPVTDELCQALTLITHTQGHVLRGGLGLRHLCDWAAFVDKKLTDELRESLDPILKKVGLYKFYRVLTKTCQKFLLDKEFLLDESISESTRLRDMLMLDFMFCGNFGRKDPASLHGSSVFTKPTVIEGADGSSTTKVKVGKNMLDVIKHSWPITQKHRILIPVGFIYVPIRYVFRVLCGKRKLISPKFISTTSRRNHLYRQLDIFKKEEGDV